MRKIFKRLSYVIISFALVFMMIVAGITPATIFVKAESSVEAFEKINVMDDLANATIGGKPFDLEKYNFDEKKETQILSFVEYCYSFYQEKQEDYGLYVYIYNPKGLKFDTESSLNAIQLATTKETDSAYAKYPLEYINKSDKASYEGLFYKFKISLTDEQKLAILHGVNSSSRIYKVSSFELLKKGDINATDYTISSTYNYSGYAQGYGPDEDAESTLTYTSESLETLTLDVHATTYRPDGTNGKNDYTQDSLHSVYFSVPNEVIEQYGAMTAVHATWLNAVLAPALVTGNQSIYEEIYNYLGKSAATYSEDIDYMLLGAYDKDAGSIHTGIDTHKYGYGYNPFPSYSSGNGGITQNAFYGGKLDKLYLLFNAGSGTDSADSYTVSSEEIIEQLKLSSSILGGELVNGKYSKSVFESVDSEFTEVNIYADENFSLTSETVSQNWWEKLWGLSGSIVTSSSFDGIQAIYAVKDSDLVGTEAQISERLYISQSDCDEFKKYYEEKKENNTVYLFRYQVSDYVSQEVTSFKRKYDIFGLYDGFNKVDTNSYFFKQTVNLDFDIIDVTFSTGEVETVIPVVSNPIDVIPDATPPVFTTSDEEGDWLIWLKIIAVLILIGLILYFFWPIASPILVWILKAVLWLILLPFRLIGKLAKSISKKRRK